MHLTDRFIRPPAICAAGLVGLVLWTCGSALGQAPMPRPASLGPSAPPPPSLPPAPPPALPPVNTPTVVPPVAASGPRVQVAEVIIRGTRNMSEPTVKSYIKTRAGADYNADQVLEDTRSLFATKMFANVHVTLETLPDGRVKVYFNLTDLPSLIQKIEYRGAKHYKDDELNQATGLHVDAPLNPMTNKYACQAIIKKYNEAGRPFADCVLLKGDKVGDTEIVFQITEGPTVKVSDIQFTGNSFVTGAVLATHINSSKKILGVFGGDYNKQMIEEDVGKLKEYYRSFGYHDVDVSVEVQYLPDGRNAVVVFHIIEGVRYRLKAPPTVVGVNPATAEQLEQLNTKLKANDYYSGPELSKISTEMQDYLGETGHKTEVEQLLSWSNEIPGVVTVQYKINEHKPARVGQIIIIGNERTKMNVILRQVGLYPGQVLSWPEIRLAEKNLARLGIFKSSPDGATRPTITVQDGPGGPDSEYKDVIIKVDEDNTGSLLFGVGVNSDAGLTGSIVLNERNFDILNPPTSWEDIWEGRAWRGAGQEFRLEAVPGTELQRYTATFREPFLFDSQFSLTASAYYYEREYNEYTEERLGSRLTLGHKLGNLFNWKEAQYWTATGSIRIENVNVGNIAAPSPPLVVPPADFTSVEGNNFLVGFKAGLTRDTRDSFLRPTEGSVLNLSFEEVTGDHTYPLANVEFNKYWTIYQRADGSGRHVLAMHNQISWAGSDTPVYDRYYAGGFQSMRGFEFRGVGPDIDGYKVGGDFMLLNSLEYQIPIKASDSIYVVGFVDSGTVETNISHITDYRVAVGVGVRFVIPILGPVPIALDLGFPIVKGPEDNSQVFSFWLGFFR
jgi:outer membrane protein insertion porin family